MIGSFEPRPGRAYSGDEPLYITPDVYIHKVGDKYLVVLNDDGLPRLRVSSTYRGVLGDKDPARSRRATTCTTSCGRAVWLIRSIHQRQRTIVRVTESILKFPARLLRPRHRALRPLILRDVADDIGMHESTVCRVTTNKYVHTPHGILRAEVLLQLEHPHQRRRLDRVRGVKEKIGKLIRAEDRAQALVGPEDRRAAARSRTSTSRAAP